MLACTGHFAERYPNTARALIRTLLDASRFIEESRENRLGTAQLISGADYVDTRRGAARQRFLGHYEDGLDGHWEDQAPPSLPSPGRGQSPYLSDGLWFLTQFRRWGLLREEPDYWPSPRPCSAPSCTGRPPPTWGWRYRRPGAAAPCSTVAPGTAAIRPVTPAASPSTRSATTRENDLAHLLIDDTPSRFGRLKAALIEAGFEVIEESGLTIDLPARIEALRPDVILFDTQSPGATSWNRSAWSPATAAPIVMFTTSMTRRDAPGHPVGVSAYIVEGIQTSRLQAIIDVARARFETDQALRANSRPASSSCWSARRSTRPRGC